MTLVALVLGAALAVVCVLFVARPFLREPDPVEDRLEEPDELERSRLARAEERDRALAALKELEFDHRTGTVSDEDYRLLVGPLRRRAAETLRPFATPGRGKEGATTKGGRELIEIPEQPVPPEPPQVVPEPYPPPGEADLPQPPVIPEPLPEPGTPDRI